MKIAIISDSHDNIPNIEKFLEWANKNDIETIIHCGDIAAPGTVKNTFAPQFSGPIHLVYGNVADRDSMPHIVEEFSHITLHGDVGEVTLGGKKMAFCHFPEIAKELAATGKYDMVFYGHTHKPWEEKIGDCRVVNPGTLAGMFSKATFALYNTDTGALELKILELL